MTHSMLQHGAHVLRGKWAVAEHQYPAATPSKIDNVISDPTADLARKAILPRDAQLPWSTKPAVRAKHYPLARRGESLRASITLNKPPIQARFATTNSAHADLTVNAFCELILLDRC
jgi:hypothetical protein